MAKLNPDEITQLIEELREQSELGITKIDYVFTMVNALCELHAEIYQKPKVKELMEKLEKYVDNHQTAKAR